MTRPFAIRRSTMADLQSMLEIFAYARCFMAESGNPGQWINGYPDRKCLLEDIRNGSSYVCLAEESIVGTFVLQEGDDPTYENIYGGRWLNDAPYLTIHRIAGNGKAKGILHAALQFALQRCHNIRIDTHRDNQVMLNALRKEGFHYCGIIHCWSGDERMAFQLA